MVYRTNGTLLLKLSFVRDRVYVTLEVGLGSIPKSWEKGGILIYLFS